MATDLMFWRGRLAKVALVSLACLVVVVAVLAIRPTAEAQSTISDGSFIRQAGTEPGRDIYHVFIVNGRQYKWLIINPTAFCSYGCPWNQVHDVSESVMDQYTTSAYARRAGDSTVWYFIKSGDSGTRHRLNMTSAERAAAGIAETQVYLSISMTDFNQYGRGSDLTCLNYPGSCGHEPVVTIRSSSLTYEEGTPVSSRWVATVSDQDTSRSNLTVTVSGLPSGLRHSFSTSTGRVTISGTLASGTAGTHQVTVRASDGRLSDDDTFRVRVRSGASPPVINVRGDQSFDAGQRLSSVVANVSDQDTPLRNLDVTVRGLPRDLSYSFNHSNGQVTISGTVSLSAPRSSRVTITANDRTTTATERFTIYVAPPNRAPEISGTSDRTWREGQSVSSLQVASVTDRDSTLRSRDVTISGLPSGLAKDSYRASDGRLTISGTLAQGSAGTYTATISANDGTRTARATFSIYVTTAPEPPNIDIPNNDLVYAARSTVSSQHVATVSDQDTPLSSLDVNVVGLPSGLHWQFDTSNGQVTISGAAPSSAGTHTVSISANDGASMPSGAFTVEVTSDTDTDTGTSSDCAISLSPSSPPSLREGQQVSSQRVATITVECPGSLLPDVDVSINGLPSGLSGSYDTAGRTRHVTVTGVVASETAGTYTATIRASDGVAVHDEATIQITVIRTCDIPAIVREAPLAPGETWTREGEWTSNDCVTAASQFITDHIGHYRDIYSFRVSDAVEVTIDLESEDVGTYIHLLDNSGQRVTLTGTASDGNDAQVTANLKRGETYWIRATTAALGATGRYTLSVITSRLSLPLGHEGDCLPEDYDLGEGSNLEDVDDRLEDGDCSSEHASFGLSDPKSDLYKFSLTSRATVAIEISTPSKQSQVVPVHRVVLARSDGRVIGENIGFTIASLSRRATTTATLWPGKYWVEVATGSADTLSYSLQLTVIECSTTELDLAAKPHQELGGRLAGDEDDCRSTPVDDAPSKWADAYTFHLDQPAYMQFAVRTESNVSPAIRLFDGDSNHTSMYGGKQMDVHWQRLATSRGWLHAGTWRLEVTKEGDDDTDYGLTVTKRMAVADKSTAAVIATKYAPTLKFNKGEDYQPVPIEAMLYYSELKVDVSRGADNVLAAGAGLGKSKKQLLTVGVLRQHNDREKHYLDLNTDYRKKPGAGSDQCSAAQCKKLVYAHVADVTDAAAGTTGTIVQYWFFYLYNGTGTVGNHQGDWEGITLYFANVDATELRTADIAPDEVGFASHGGGFAATRQISGDTASDANAACGRMDVYVAQNRHGNYPEKGTDDFHGHEGGSDSDAPGLGDRYNGDGDVWTPSTYAIRLIDTSKASWFHWPGKWGGGNKTKGAGQKTGRYLVPHGPQFNTNRWFWHRPSEMVSRGWGEFTFNCSHEWTPVEQGEEAAG